MYVAYHTGSKSDFWIMEAGDAGVVLVAQKDYAKVETTLDIDEFRDYVNACRRLLDKLEKKK